MKQDMRNGGNGTNRLFSRLAAEKKKTVTALCLIAVMVFMWARVLGRKTPETAEAALKQGEVDPDTSESNSQLKISFIELPRVAGRNDVLTRDFFAADGWQDFLDGVGSNKDEGVGRRIAEKLRLEAIVMGENPQAVINDKLISVGDKVSVRVRGDNYECEVVGIEEETVFIRWGDEEITLEIAKDIEVAN